MSARLGRKRAEIINHFPASDCLRICRVGGEWVICPKQAWTRLQRADPKCTPRTPKKWVKFVFEHKIIPLISSPAVERAHDELFYCSRWWWFVCFSEKLLHKNENKKVFFFPGKHKKCLVLCAGVPSAWHILGRNRYLLLVVVVSIIQRD